jgi:modulator of FtsH protease
MALAATGATFLALPTWVLTTRGDFSFLGGFLFAGMVIALISGMSLLKTSRIVNGGETNDVLATVGLYVSIFNLFTSLLSLLGFGSSDE